MLFNKQLTFTHHMVDSNNQVNVVPADPKSNMVKKAILIPVSTSSSSPTSALQLNKQQQPQQKPLTAFGATTSSSPQANEAKVAKSRRLRIPTIRFEVDLDKPTSDAFNEFNYNKLALKVFKQLKRTSNKLKDKEIDIVKIKKKECEKLDENSELIVNRKKIILSKKLDSFKDDLNESSTKLADDENDRESEMEFDGDDSQASQFKHNQKDYDMDMYKYKLKNFSHLGTGYDESDSFIDNSDAHDVNVPKNMVPNRGGFYINGEKIQLRPKERRQRSTNVNSKQTNTGKRETSKKKQQNTNRATSAEDTLKNEKDEDVEEEDDDEESSSSEETSGSESESNSSSDDSDSDDEDEKSNLSTTSSSSSSKESIIEVNDCKSNVSSAAVNVANKKKSSDVGSKKKPKVDDDDEVKPTLNKENEKSQVVQPTAATRTAVSLPTTSTLDNTKKRKGGDTIHSDFQHSVKVSSLSPSENLAPKKKKIDGHINISTSSGMTSIPKAQETSSLKSTNHPASNGVHSTNQITKQQSHQQQHHQQSTINRNAAILAHQQQQQSSQKQKPVQGSGQAAATTKTATTTTTSPAATASSGLLELTAEMRNKLNQLRAEFVIYRQQQLQRQSPNITPDIIAARFMDLPSSSAHICALDVLVRSTKQLAFKELILTQLGEIFELARAQPQRDMLTRKYHNILTQARIRNLENNLKNKLDELKALIDSEMPKNQEKYARAMDEFKKQKEMLSSLPLDSEKVSAGSKNPPRKRFEMSDRVRQIILNIIHLKMAMYKPPPLASQQQRFEETESALKLAYIQQFFDSELIPLWPKNWMQKNVLLNIYTTKYFQQQKQQQQQQQSSPLQSPQKCDPSSTGVTILSSQQFPNKQMAQSLLSQQYAVTSQSIPTSTQIKAPFSYQVDF